MQFSSWLLMGGERKRRSDVPAVFLPVLMLMIGSFSSCGETEHYAPVSGVVTLNGSPLKNAKLVFEPIGDSSGAAPGKPSYGRTNESGRYRLESFVPKRNGAIVGEHRVRIVTIAAMEPTEKQRAAARRTLENRGDTDGNEKVDVSEDQIREYLGNTLRSQVKEILPSRYHAGTELRIRVEPQGTDQANFELRTP